MNRVGSVQRVAVLARKSNDLYFRPILFLGEFINLSIFGLAPKKFPSHFARATPSEPKGERGIFFIKKIIMNFNSPSLEIGELKSELQLNPFNCFNFIS